jgi:putative transposase
MSRRGNCWDNAMAESSFSSLKKERIRKRIYKTRELVHTDIFDYIEVFYNRTRRHSHLGQVSPEAFERASM